ncbi:hypothetical protein [Desulfurococcus amylolyticus]|uniref:hypothetical protein n=1 Tax=Desulfurococcus amylolyticus TaxID=94694 RepID=UPI00022DFE56|nr:hypothetical protein [Desulfurococcus amylolyticus]
MDRRGILERIRAFHRKARNIIIDWSKKTGLEIVGTAKQNLHVVVRGDLNGLVESVRELSKNHRKKPILLSYRSRLAPGLPGVTRVEGFDACLLGDLGETVSKPSAQRGGKYLLSRKPSPRVVKSSKRILCQRLERVLTV